MFPTGTVKFGPELTSNKRLLVPRASPLLTKMMVFDT